MLNACVVKKTKNPKEKKNYKIREMLATDHYDVADAKEDLKMILFKAVVVV